jgi:hypothetical protein
MALITHGGSRGSSGSGGLGAALSTEPANLRSGVVVVLVAAGLMIPKASRACRTRGSGLAGVHYVPKAFVMRVCVALGVGAAFETVVLVLAACMGAAVFLELGHADGWQGRGGMVLGLVMVDLVDGYGRMDDVRLYGLFVDDWLVGFVDVTWEVYRKHSRARIDGYEERWNLLMNVLALDNGNMALRVSSFDPLGLILELRGLGLERSLGF